MHQRLSQIFYRALVTVILLQMFRNFMKTINCVSDGSQVLSGQLMNHAFPSSVTNDCTCTASLLQMEIDHAINSAIRSLNANMTNLPWNTDHLQEGIYHTIDAVGTQYEMYFFNKTHLERVSVFRPLGPASIVRRDSIQLKNKINIILPLTADRLSTLRTFLENYGKIISRRENLYLTIVFYGKSSDELTILFSRFAREHQYRNYIVKHVPDRNFSRGYALDHGIRAWRGRSDVITFLCDVDIHFNMEFLERCSANTEPGKRVYYPIVFSLYNPEVSDCDGEGQGVRPGAI